MLEKVDRALDDRTMENLSKQDVVCLSADSWSSQNRDTFLYAQFFFLFDSFSIYSQSLVFHYIDKDWNLIHAATDFFECSGKDAESSARDIKKVIEQRFPGDQVIFAKVSDGAAVEAKTAELSKMVSLNCF